jgi:hypothetical protein
LNFQFSYLLPKPPARPGFDLRDLSTPCFKPVANPMIHQRRIDVDFRFCLQMLTRLM